MLSSVQQSSFSTKMTLMPTAFWPIHSPIPSHALAFHCLLSSFDPCMACRGFHQFIQWQVVDYSRNGLEIVWLVESFPPICPVIILEASTNLSSDHSWDFHQFVQLQAIVQRMPPPTCPMTSASSGGFHQFVQWLLTYLLHYYCLAKGCTCVGDIHVTNILHVNMPWH